MHYETLYRALEDTPSNSKIKSCFNSFKQFGKTSNSFEYLIVLLFSDT